MVVIVVLSSIHDLLIVKKSSISDDSVSCSVSVGISFSESVFR